MSTGNDRFIISWEEAEHDMIRWAREADGDELAHMYGVMFGVDVDVDAFAEELICTPNANYVGHRSTPEKPDV